VPASGHKQRRRPSIDVHPLLLLRDTTSTRCPTRRECGATVLPQRSTSSLARWAPCGRADDTTTSGSSSRRPRTRSRPELLPAPATRGPPPAMLAPESRPGASTDCRRSVPHRRRLSSTGQLRATGTDRDARRQRRGRHGAVPLAQTTHRLLTSPSQDRDHAASNRQPALATARQITSIPSSAPPAQPRSCSARGSGGTARTYDGRLFCRIGRAEPDGHLQEQQSPAQASAALDPENRKLAPAAKARAGDAVAAHSGRLRTPGGGRVSSGEYDTPAVPIGTIPSRTL